MLWMAVGHVGKFIGYNDANKTRPRGQNFEAYVCCVKDVDFKINYEGISNSEGRCARE